jgi:hypothetical protein
MLSGVTDSKISITCMLHDDEEPHTLVGKSSIFKLATRELNNAVYCESNSERSTCGGIICSNEKINNFISN